jgi:uncharacterized protein YukE
MSDITLNYDDIDDAASKLEDGQTAIVDLIDELQDLISELTDGGFNTNQASGAYLDTFTDLAQQLKEASDAIPAAAQSLRAIKDMFDDTDSSAAGS